MEQIYEYIRVIHQAGSFRHAAQRLHVTQPALSIALRKYEAQIGATVFDRKKHPISPTPAGAVILRSIEQIYLDERRMYAELADLMELSSGELSIGTTHYVSACILPPILNRFRTLCPKIRVHLSEKSSNEVVREFSNGAFDVALYANRLETDKVLQIPVFHDRLFLAIPNRFLDPDTIRIHAIPPDRLDEPDCRPALPSLALLGSIPFIALLPGDRLYEQASALFFEAQVAPQVSMNVPQSITAWHMACAGIGAALAPETVIRRVPPGSAEISVFSYSSALMERWIYAAYKTDQYVPTATRKFICLCRDAPEPVPEI